MARPPRIEFPGAFYHVIVRGIRCWLIAGAEKGFVHVVEISEIGGQRGWAEGRERNIEKA